MVQPIRSPEVIPLSMKRRVLLLDDDDDFKGIIRDFLESNTCEVVAVNNGAEGVREILARDFDAIVCDMMMPNLPGDMFYLAVERMRPHLCRRFIFMTGHTGNGQVMDFIGRVKGPVLSKPFHIENLLDLLDFVEVRAAVAPYLN